MVPKMTVIESQHEPRILISSRFAKGSIILQKTPYKLLVYMPGTPMRQHLLQLGCIISSFQTLASEDNVK